MATVVVTGKAQCRSKLPQVNLFDIPRLMPGAHSSATASQRTFFQERCRKLYEDEMPVQSVSALVATADVTVDELEAMFPSLDPALVRALASDVLTPYHAMETLLALATAVSEPAQPPMPPKDLGLESIDAFPSLTDADGWQVASQSLFDRNIDKDLGSAWRDRAKVVASKPAPCPPTAANAVAPKRRAGKQDEALSDIAQPETDYEFRQRRGKQRVHNRARFQAPKKGVATANSDAGGLGERSRESDGSEGEEEEPHVADNGAANGTHC